ncbi:MAG: hypothetical protein ACFFAS_20315 [Promethearchaeota archaeon]
MTQNDPIKTEAPANCKVVKPPIWVRSINFEDYLFRPKKDTDFTTLTKAQQTAIKNIEEYWIRRTKNYYNWKSQKHWNYKRETISARIEKHLYNELKTNNNNKSIQNFIRHFLRDIDFRNLYLNKLHEQFEKDLRLWFLDYLDYTDKKAKIIEIFPKVISGEINTIEKELFTFYSTFLTDFSMSYMIRVALIHFRHESPSEPINKEEVIYIMRTLVRRD